MPVKVSIVVTCYNLGRYLPEALESIVAYPDHDTYEVIIVDDGSTDPETVAVVDGLDTQRFKVVRQPNLGLAAARNNGIKLAQGVYVIPFDADNRMLPSMIKKVIEIFDADIDVDVVYSDQQRFGDQDFRFMVGEFNFGRLYRKNYIDACAGIRKSLWERLGGYDQRMPVMGFEDWDLWLRASVSGARFHYVPEVLYEYRVREGSMLSNARANQIILEEYIFSKPGLTFLRELRSEHIGLLAHKNQVLSGREHWQKVREHFVMMLSFAVKRINRASSVIRSSKENVKRV